LIETDDSLSTDPNIRMICLYIVGFD
jgi:hypothetical protein